MPNCLERHSLCTEANWGLPTQHFQKGIVVGINKKYQKQKKKIWSNKFSSQLTFTKYLKFKYKYRSIFRTLWSFIFQNSKFDS